MRHAVLAVAVVHYRAAVLGGGGGEEIPRQPVEILKCSLPPRPTFSPIPPPFPGHNQTFLSKWALFPIK